MELQEAYWFSKDKIPRTLSYPLKRSVLDKALERASVKGDVYSVRYLGHQNRTTVLSSLFSPEPHPYHGAGKSLITVWAVAPQQRRQAEQVLVADGLPLLCNWLLRAERAGNVWRSTGHELRLDIDAGVLKHHET